MGKTAKFIRGDIRTVFNRISGSSRLLTRGFFIARKKGTFMNDCQRRQIEAMRKQGMGYKAIARETKLSRDSVRNYCRWHHLNGYGIMGPLSRPRSKILRVAVSRIILSSEASKVKLVGNLVA